MTLLKQLLILDISLNKNFRSVDFLESNESIRVLQLIDTNVMKLENTIYYLRQMKNLRYLDIKATQSEIMIIRKELPHCIVNGYKPMNL